LYNSSQSAVNLNKNADIGGQGLSGKLKWSRSIAQHWKNPDYCKILGHNSYTTELSRTVANLLSKFPKVCYHDNKGRSL